MRARADRHRRRIIAATTELIERGHIPTITEVGIATGLNRRTIERHFGNDGESTLADLFRACGYREVHKLVKLDPFGRPAVPPNAPPMPAPGMAWSYTGTGLDGQWVSLPGYPL